jgi:hypothetical protein
LIAVVVVVVAVCVADDCWCRLLVVEFEHKNLNYCY